MSRSAILIFNVLRQPLDFFYIVLFFKTFKLYWLLIFVLHRTIRVFIILEGVQSIGSKDMEYLNNIMQDENNEVAEIVLEYKKPDKYYTTKDMLKGKSKVGMAINHNFRFV